MTQSQIDHYNIDCQSFVVKPTQHPKPTFSLMIDAILKPFRQMLAMAGIEVKLNFVLNGTDLNLPENEITISNLYTDWSVFECIMFHLVSNSVKHGSKNMPLQINIIIEGGGHSDDLNFKEYTHTLKCEVVNYVDKIDESAWAQITKLNFCFQKAGWRQGPNQTHGLGIGMSTAHTLASAIGGRLYYEIGLEQKIIRAVFNIKLTSPEMLEDYIELAKNSFVIDDDDCDDRFIRYNI
jgi:hypothetical protein